MHFQDISHGDAPYVVSPKILAACKKAFHRTSTVSDYEQFIDFYDGFLEYHALIPPFMKTPALILECLMDCWCNLTDCPQKHSRKWVSNYTFLRTHNLLGQVKELRIVLYNDSAEELNLDQALEDLCIPQGAIAGTKLIIEIMLLLRSELHSQLTQLQIARPFPKALGKPFASNLEILDIDLDLLSELTSLPKIPIKHRRKLALYAIRRQIDWDMFEAEPDGEMTFGHLEEIVLQFANGHANSGYFVTDKCNVAFPVTTCVKTIGLLNVLYCATYVHIMYLYRRNDEQTAYTSHCMHRLYRHRNKWVRGLRLTGISYPMPVKINWRGLRWMHIEASIADINSIINVVSQLKDLETLIIDCFSMKRSHLTVPERGEHFADQTSMFYSIGEAVSSISDEVGSKLTRLDIRSRKALCVDSVLRLTAILPNLQELGVNEESIEAVSTRSSNPRIRVREFTLHINEVDKARDKYYYE
ncbi:hypothetical protein EC988_002830 [Linderina pennispora]|nr:hypothetical protein EC988_002830 [Linderina pennispora]